MAEARAFAVVEVGEVPAGDDWLGAREREAMRRFSVPRRREEWRAGRWAARRAVAVLDGHDVSRLEVLTAPDGAPEVWEGDHRSSVAVSISHRGGFAAALATAAGADPGCDLEVVEPRDAAFAEDWFTPDERAAVHSALPADQDVLVTLIWSAKETALKVLRHGLRVDTRQVEISVGEGSFEATFGGVRIPGRWRRDGAIVITTAAMEKRA
jgi:4'-phosphopantetheinyl transferase